ncbi:ATP-binding cassette domain-containing protein [Streptomyces acidicola]|uniref:ATP-binding cassette domain-containing protein n=1 Tax=Streptomyces acidicola TaxID=2596892 RepID=UPI003F4DAFBC
MLRNVSLTVAPSESLGLLGRSSCGKSPLARVVALFHRPDSGTLLIEWRLLRESNGFSLSVT